MNIDETLKLLETVSKYKIRELSYDGLKVVFDYQQNSIQPVVVKETQEFKLPELKFKTNPYFETNLKPEDILKPPTHLDKLTEEEVLYAATPYFDELQAKKQMHEEQLKNDSI